MDIWTSWTFGHHGHLDIMDIWTSWIFGHHGYLDIMDFGTSWTWGHGFKCAKFYTLTFETLPDAGFWGHFLLVHFESIICNGRKMKLQSELPSHQPCNQDGTGETMIDFPLSVMTFPSFPTKAWTNRFRFPGSPFSNGRGGSPRYFDPERGMQILLK